MGARRARWAGRRLENLGHPDHPRHDRALVDGLVAKLHAIVAREIGEDLPPFDLNMFGTREVRYTRGGPEAPAETRETIARRAETSPTSAG